MIALQKQLDAEKDSHERTRLSMNAEYERKLDELKENHKKEMGELAALNTEATALYNAKVETMEADFKVKARELEDNFTYQTEDIYNELQEAKGKLVVKQNVMKSMPDHEIASRFAVIEELVTDFSRDIGRQSWESARSRQPFPFSESELKRLHKANTRVLKMQLIENTVWLILSDRIFSTPFKVLGREGEIWDDEWKRTFKGQFLTHSISIYLH